MNGKILIVEDEEKIARFLELELTHEGYAVDKAFDGKRGLEMAQSRVYDLILLDILLPGLNGMEVLRRLKRHSDVPVDVPIILLTAKDAVNDKVSGLDGGADDYITKPFAIEELLARIRTVMRKKNSRGKICQVGGLMLDADSYTVSYNGEPINLTKREFDLLHMLMENQGIVLNRETLLSKVWGYDYAGETNVVDVYIRYLRAKVDDVFQIKLISTVRGIGYIIKHE